jgi:hypothetical protein
MSPSRGVLYLQWGPNYDQLVQRSLTSLRAVHPSLPVHIHTVSEGSTLLEKAQMLDLSPFEETLYLDADTLVIDNLDFGFEQAQRFGLAGCICECPWARRFGGLTGDLIEYNTGVLFFTRHARPVFDAWKDWAGRLDSSIRFRDLENQITIMPVNDQASFAQAIAVTKFNPCVLPLNWNFRPKWHHTFFGPLKIWHDYSAPPPGIFEAARQQTGNQKVIDFYKLK